MPHAAPLLLLFLAQADPAVPALGSPASEAAERTQSSTLAEEAPVEAEKPAPARAKAGVRADEFFALSDFVDTRVTFAFSNNNVLAGPGERMYQASGYRIGVDPKFNVFLENVNTRFSGYETLSQLVLYKRLPAFWDRWETEAALAGRLAANTDTSEIRFYDAGTYLRVIYKLGDGNEDKAGAVDLTAWPVSSDRFRLGYTYLISWGGTSIFPGKLVSSIVEGAVPGVRLRWRSPGGTSYAFLGMKSVLLRSLESNQRAGELVPQYGLLLGGGTTVAEHLILEANGGFFQKSTQETLGLEGRPMRAFGASARITYFEGTPPANSLDYRLLRNDPTAPENNYLWKPYRPGTGYSLALEGTVMAQNLADPDQFASEVIVPAVAGGLVGLLKIDEWSFRLDAFLQTLDFIVFDVPGFTPNQATAKGTKTTPEFFSALTVEYFWADLNLKPTISLGVKVQATYQGVAPAEQGTTATGQARTQIITDNRTHLILPPGSGATPVIGAVLKLPLGLSESTAISAEARFELDDNQVRIAQDNERGEVTYFFDSPARLAIAAVLQSRW